MSRTQTGFPPCPLCGRVTRVHSEIVVRDIEIPGDKVQTAFTAVICRDCAFAMAVRNLAATAAPKQPAVQSAPVVAQQLALLPAIGLSAAMALQPV